MSGGLSPIQDLAHGAGLQTLTLKSNIFLICHSSKIDKTYQLKHWCSVLILATDANRSGPRRVEQQHLTPIRLCIDQAGLPSVVFVIHN